MGFDQHDDDSGDTGTSADAAGSAGTEASASTGSESVWKARLRKAGTAAMATGAVAASKAKDLSADALDKGKELSADLGAKLDESGLKDSARQAGSTVARTSGQALGHAATTGKELTSTARAKAGELGPGSRYAPERVTHDTKVRGAPHVWALWAVGGWLGVHRFADGANRKGAWRRVTIATLLAVAVTVLAVLLINVVGATPGSLARAFGIDVAAGRVGSWSEAVDEFRSNAERQLWRAAALGAVIVVGVSVIFLFWLREAFWVAKYTKGKKRLNQQRKEEALRQQRELAAAPAGQVAAAEQTKGLPAQ